MTNQPSSDWIASPQWTNKLLAAAVLVSLFITIVALSPDIWDKYRVVRDTQNYYWMARYQDPTLFATDYLWARQQVIEVKIFGWPLLIYTISPGFGLLFYPTSLIMDYVWAVKWLVVVLMPLSVVYLFKVGRALGDNSTGLHLVFLFTFFILASPLSISLGTGMQRGFSVPLLIVFLYYLVNKKYVGAGVMIFLSAAIYVPNFLLTVPVYALSLLKIERPFKWSLTLTWAKLIPLLVSVVLSGFIVALGLAVQYWGFASASPGAAMAEAEDLLYIGFPFLGRAGLFDTGSDAINFAVLLVFGFLIYKIVGPASLKRVPGAVWWLLAVGLTLFVVAVFFTFQPWWSFNIYYPSRYTRASLFVVAICFVGLNWTDFLARAPAWFRQKAPLLWFFAGSLGLSLLLIFVVMPAQLPLIPFLLLLGLLVGGAAVLLGWAGLWWLLYPAVILATSSRREVIGLSQRRGRVLAALVIVVAMVIIGGIYIKTLGLKTSNPSASARELYRFVATLPKDVVLAGDPPILTDIPPFAKRSVLFTDLHPGQSNAAIVDYFDAQYSASPATVLNFCRHYQVDYLIVNEEVFTPAYLSEQNFYYPPHNDKIIKTIAGRSDFVLLRFKPVFTSGPYRLIKCDEATIH